MRLQRLGVCLSHRATLKTVDQMGSQHDQQVMTWAHNLTERSLTFGLRYAHTIGDYCLSFQQESLFLQGAPSLAVPSGEQVEVSTTSVDESRDFSFDAEMDTFFCVWASRGNPSYNSFINT